MKIAILSMQRVINFGSVLQAYSLRQILREVSGGEVSFLDIEDMPALPSKRSIREDIDYASAADYPAGITQRVKRRCIAMLSSHNKRLIRRFMKNQLRLDEKNNSDTYDCVVIGSDEVFNHVRGVRLQLHGQVRQAGKVLGYAASCGSADISDVAPEDIPQMKSAMSRFCGMSVRDEATRRYAEAVYSGKIYKHLDPVLVGDLYRRAHKPVALKKYLLVYAYGQRIRTKEEISAIQNFARSRGLKTVAVGGSQFWCDLYLPVSPLRLLDYFYYADYVVTDTFHGTIFSVINRKKFAVIVRTTNKNKLEGLLEDLQLQDRVIDDMEHLETVISREIQYDQVDAVLQQERERTRHYLRMHLGGSDETNQTV